MEQPPEFRISWYNRALTEILLVDDDRTIRDSLSHQLREAGFGIRVAATGAAGVAAFGERLDARRGVGYALVRGE